jgi:hypothetical protein
MPETGWIKLHRRMLEWGWYKDVPVYKLFTHLLLTANREPKSWKGIKIKAGQVVTGRHSLAEQTGLTEQQVRTAIDKLISTNEITISATNRSTLISIVNWQSYQAINQEINQQITNKQPTDNHKQEGRELEEGKEERERRTIFFETSATLIESIRMRWGITLDQLNRMLDDFDLHILAEGKSGITDAEYRSYFHNWGAKRYLEFKGSTTQNGMVF